MGLSTFYRRANPGVSAAFNTTHWSLVLRAGGASEAASREALEQLCQAYWYPLYVFARRQGYDAQESEDLTQEFVFRLLRRNDLASLSPERGRFRAFLVAAFKNFLSKEYHRQHAEKRGGCAITMSLDCEAAEVRYQLERWDTATPEHCFERRWAMTLLDQTLERVRREYAASERAGLFEVLQEFLSDQRPVPHAAIAQKFGISVGAVGVTICRLRQRYRDVLREEVLRTVAGPEEVDDEIQRLIAAVAR